MGRITSGYTVIEVMIFLAITGVLLASAMLVFNGRQRNPQFTQSAHELNSGIRDIINEVGSGYFPDSGNFSCSINPLGNVVINPSGSSPQGTNTQCIFVGKAIHFHADNYSVYTVVGRKQLNNRDVTSLEEARPTVAADLTTTGTLIWGLRVDSMQLLRSSERPDCPCDIGSIAFLQTLSKTTDETNPISGSQNVQMYPIEGVLVSEPDPNFGSVIQNNAVSGSLDREANPVGGLVICLSDGARKAAITLGGSGRQLSTETFFDGAIPQECQ